MSADVLTCPDIRERHYSPDLHSVRPAAPVLLGAVCDCEVICNLQSDVRVEELKPDSSVVVTNYFLRGSGSESASISE